MIVIKKKNVEIFQKSNGSLNKLVGPLVSIVTTAYNNEKFNEKYFDSLNNQTYRKFEVIFVDNLSPDKTREDAIRRLKNGKIVYSKINLGCAGGNNLGVKEAKGKYIFLLGPDTHVDSKCIERLVHSAKSSDNYIYAPRQMTYDGKSLIGCGIATDIFGYPRKTYEKNGTLLTQKLFYADGTGIFMTRKNYIKIGGMDEGTFLFAEDVELSWRAHLHGMGLVPVMDSIVYHWSGGAVGVGGFPKGKVYETNSHRRFLAEKNIIRNILKNYQWWNLFWGLPMYLSINILAMITLFLVGQRHAISKTYLKAYWWNIQNFKSTLIERRKIQKSRTVGDRHIFKLMTFFPSKFRIIKEIGIPKIN